MLVESVIKIKVMYVESCVFLFIRFMENYFKIPMILLVVSGCVQFDKAWNYINLQKKISIQGGDVNCNCRVFMSW